VIGFYEPRCLADPAFFDTPERKAGRTHGWSGVASFLVRARDQEVAVSCSGSCHC
jgi:hypothetical protein